MFGAFFAVFAIVLAALMMLTFYTPYKQHICKRRRHCHGGGSLHYRVRIDRHRAELHRHNPQNASARSDLVPAAAVCWTLYTTSLILVLATPVLAITLFLMALAASCSAFYLLGPILVHPLCQHLFWRCIS